MKKLGTGIDFADSEFKSCEIINIKDSDTVVVYLNSWDAHIIKIVFLNIIQFSFKCGSFILGLYEMNKDEFYKKAIDSYGVTSSTIFKKFSIIDIEDVEFLEVVAEDVVVTKELQHHNRIKKEEI